MEFYRKKHDIPLPEHQNDSNGRGCCNLPPRKDFSASPVEKILPSPTLFIFQGLVCTFQALVCTFQALVCTFQALVCTFQGLKYKICLGSGNCSLRETGKKPAGREEYMI